MAQPTTYNRATSFSNYQALNPADPLPGSTLDAELNAIKTTLDGVLANLALIQADDGGLANGVVDRESFDADIEVGWSAPEVWVTATAYVVGDTVFNGSAFYRCLVAHTAGTFATDLAASKWEVIVDLSALTIVDADQIAVTPAGNIAATDVQAALEELDSEKAASSHTHPSSAISDSTSAGRNMLTAANVAAQQTLLGLGDLAYEDTIPVTDIDAQIALTGVIEPSALAANTNDWAPTGVATASTIRMSASSAINLTGLLAPAVDGTVVVLENVGSYNITLLPESASSAAANRFALPHAVVVGPNEAAVLKYDLDGTTPRWRPMAFPTTGPVAATYKNLLIVNGSTSDEQMKVTADELVVEDTNGACIRLRSVDVTASNIASGANGLDTGSVATSTGYWIWVIYNPSTNTAAALLSTSATAPTMPSGYTFKGRFGWCKTDGTSDFYAIRQVGADTVVTDSAIADVNGVNITTSTVSHTLSAPPSGIARIRVTMNLAAAVFAIVHGGFEPDQAPSNGNSNFVGHANGAAGELYLRVNASSQVKARNSSSTHTIYICTVGWVVPF